MDKALLSTGTRHAFREYFAVHGYLNQITALFEGANFHRVELAADKIPSGQRRTLVEQYYAGVDWTSRDDVQRILSVYQAVLLPLEKPGQPFDDLLKYLTADGYSYESGNLVRNQPIDLSKILDASGSLDRRAIRDHLRRIEQGIDNDPSLAIGSAKELIETVAKVVIRQAGHDPDRFDSVPQLVKEAMKSLDLSVDGSHHRTPWGDPAKQVLAGLAQIVGGIAELRNLFGTGHGRLDAPQPELRHARLVVGATSTLVIFLLDTLEGHAQRLDLQVEPGADLISRR